jgi:hypothetical protein
MYVGTMTDMDKQADLDIRSKRRRDNYWLAKRLGFTSKDARLLCKRSSKYIEQLAQK